MDTGETSEYVRTGTGSQENGRHTEGSAVAGALEKTDLEFLQDFVENAPLGLHWVGPDGLIRWANQAELDLLGYTRDEYIGHHIADFHADKAVIEDILKRLANREELRGYEARLRANDGSIRHVLISSNVCWQDDRFIHTRCFTRDVTERKQAEEKLQAEYAFRKAIEASIPAGVAAADLNGRQIYVNPAFCEMVGWSEEELVGAEPPFVYWPPEETEAIRRAFEETLEHRCPPGGFELRFRRRTGERFDVLVAVAPLTDSLGRIEAWVASVSDITAHKRTERALRESHAIRQAVTEGTTDAVYVKDREGRYLMINPAGAAFLGRTVDAVIGRDDTALFADETARRIQAFDRHIMETGEAQVSDEEATAADGVTRIYQSVKAPYRDHEGRVIGVVGVSRDITARRQSEERTRFLAEAGRVLAGALDFEETLAAVADLMVPALADWCAVDLKTPDGALQRVAVAHPDPAKVTLARELLERYPPDPEAPAGVPHVIRTGRPERYFEVPDELLQAAARDGEHLRILRELDIYSAIVVPLVARERTLGALTLVMAESGRRFGEDDVAFAEDLARRCALSVDNARLYREARAEIARREQAQQALHESERLLRFTLEATRVGTWNWDLQTDDVHWSDNLAAIHRMKPGAFAGTFEAFFADVAPEDRTRVQQAIQRAIEQGGAYHVEYRLPPGESEAEVWVEGKGTVLYDEGGRAVRMAGICMDVTERKRAEEELREKTRTLEKEIAERKRAEALVSGQKQVLELIAQGAPLAQVLDVLVRRIEEQTEGELIASILLLDAEGTHLRHGAAPSLPQAYNEAIDGVAIGEGVGSCGTAAFRRETVVVSDIATDPLWVDFRDLALSHGLCACWSTPILATDGQALGTFAIYYREPHDPSPQHRQFVSIVTRTAAIAIERSRAECRLKELNETLEQKVTERTAALAKANQQLKQENAERLRAEQELERTNEALTRRNRELQDFAYVASHDLQEPLRKIRAFADLMAADYQDVVGESGRYYLDRMQDAARRMSGLITDLLAFSRIATRGRSFEEVDLNNVVAGVLSDLDYAVREVAGRVEVADLPALEADATQMRQLFQNLIGNALKFHKPDVPPVVCIAATQEQGDALSFKGQPVCRIAVQDNGIGFDDKYLDRIFSPFQRLHGRGAYPGTGIGLAICRRIVERHHGTITAHGTPGAGATFIVTLPLRQTGEAGEAA